MTPQPTPLELLIEQARAREQRTVYRPPEPAQQDGETFDQSTDGKRLNRQMWRVVDHMKPHTAGDDCGKWYSPDQLEKDLGDNWSSLNARLRDTRKPKFACPWYCQRKKMGRGLFAYRLVRRDSETYWRECVPEVRQQ